MSSKQGVHTITILELAVVLILLLAFAGLTFIGTANAQSTTNLTVQIKSWDRIGIDQNSPEKGPNQTALQARICNNGNFTATNVTVNFSWNSDINSQYIDLHPHERMVKNLGTLEPGMCTDVFYIVGMPRQKKIEGYTRSYTLNVTSNNSNPTTTNQTLNIEGVQEQNQDDSIFVASSTSTPSKCSTFQIYVWDNITRHVTEAGFPIDYDPGVVELVNVTVKTSGKYYSGTSYDLYQPPSRDLTSSNNYVTYTLHALNYGQSGIGLIIQDKSGEAYHYNKNYPGAVPPTNVTLYLGDYVWEDSNFNGTQDTGEHGIANVTVNLYYGNGTYIRNTTTNAAGYYSFTGLMANNYTLKFVAPANYTFTKQNVGADDSIDSDANETGWTAIITSLYYGNNDLSWDVGLYQYASIGDYVWCDCSEGYYDGIQQVNENGFPNVNVSLYNSTDVVVNTTQTNALGFYSFTNLIPGDYYLVFALPDGYKWTLQDQGGDDSKDSDINPSTGRTGTITLIQGQIDLTWDAGLVSAPCLPIPEMDTLVLFSAGLLTLAGYVVLRRRK
jgi:hypothetical protein